MSINEIENFITIWVCMWDAKQFYKMGFVICKVDIRNLCCRPTLFSKLSDKGKVYLNRIQLP